MSFSTRAGCLAAFAIFGAFAIVETASAEVIFTFGQTREVMDPATFVGTSDSTEVFRERGVSGEQEFLVNLSDPLRLGDGIGDDTCEALISGDLFASDFVSQRPAELVTNQDVLVFSGRVLGIVHQGACLDSTNGYFARPELGYPVGGGLGFSSIERDALELFPSRRTVHHRLVGEPGDWDFYRVITAAPEVDADLNLRCSIDTDDVVVGVPLELRFILDNPNPVDAPDPQIIFRAPPTVLSYSDPFNCEFSPGAGVHICTHRDSAALRATEQYELTVTLSLDDARATLVRAFGSGFVNDPMLGDNVCDVSLVAPGPEDGGTDGAFPEDTSVPGDDTSTGVGDAAPVVDFRGAGGCSCEVTRRTGVDTAPALALCLVALLGWRRGRR